jgi:hypothetical protein
VVGYLVSSIKGIEGVTQINSLPDLWDNGNITFSRSACHD